MLCIIRAHNESATVGSLIARLADCPEVSSIVCVCSACTDDTAAVAAGAGAAVVECGLGLGTTTRAAFTAAAGEPFILVDGDLYNVLPTAISQLAAAAAAGRCGRGRQDVAGRSSSQLPRQAAAVGLTLPPVAPQSLTTALTSWPVGVADQLDWALVGPDRGSDLALALAAFAAGFEFEEVDVGGRDHSHRGPDHIARLAKNNEITLAAFAAGPSPGHIRVPLEA